MQDYPGAPVEIGQEVVNPPLHGVSEGFAGPERQLTALALGAPRQKVPRTVSGEGEVSPKLPGVPGFLSCPV